MSKRQLDKTTTQDTRTVIKDTTAWLLTDAMKDVLTQGTGKLARFDSQLAQAGKSGTTTSNRDCLWAGYTPVSYTHLDVYKRQSASSPTTT